MVSTSGVSNSVHLSPYAKSCCDVITPVTQLELSCDADEATTPPLSTRSQLRHFSENLFKLRQRVSRKVKKTKKKEKNAARKERKATKMLAIVLGKMLRHKNSIVSEVEI